MSSLNQWLEKIESLHPEHIELSLNRVQQVAKRLGVIQFSKPVVTVAGTNGKGSVVATLDAISKVNGKRTACYTSPHLVNFTERLTIAGQELSEQQWCEAFSQVDESRDGESLTYFEFTTLAALCLIKQSNIDLIILEIGLGGRLDAVNVVMNDIAVITSIGFDHEDWLGDSLEAIASEKAGIIQPQSTVVVSNQEVANLIKGSALDKKLVIANSISLESSQITSLVNKLKFQIYPDSFYCALAAASHLGMNLINIDSKKLSSYIKLKGRWQQFKPYQVWCDVAHNPQATGYLLEKIKSVTSVSHWIFIVGMLKDKRALNSLTHFSAIDAHWYCVDTEGPRALAGEDLAGILKSSVGGSVQTANNPEQAFQQALNGKALTDIPSDVGIVAFGSFHVVSKMIEYMKDC